MRIIGIDYGMARTGVAITDELGLMAHGLETIVQNGNDKKTLARLDEIIKEYKVSKIVIGLPISMDGSKSERTLKTEQFIHKLKCKFNTIPIETMDERLTTVQAHRTMNELNVKGRKKRGIVDTISAEYILEAYMKLNLYNKK